MSRSDSHRTKWILFVYDLLIFLVVALFMLVLYKGTAKPSLTMALYHAALSALCLFGFRLVGRVYDQVWRYGGIQCYIRLLVTDAAAFLVNLALNYLLPLPANIGFARILGIVSLNCLASLGIRMVYRYIYKTGRYTWLLKAASLGRVTVTRKAETRRVRVGIVGAGRVGVSLAEELLSNENAACTPLCFIETDPAKVGREIHGLPVISEQELPEKVDVQEVVFAIPGMEMESKKELYEKYTALGYKVKVYDFPAMETPGARRALREFDVEDLLFRRQIVVTDEKTSAYYRGKTVMITGGGGSIGSELCRQLARMAPKRVVLLDVYENGAYDVQQELRIAYQGKLDLKVCICSVCNPAALDRAFETYKPEIVIHAAAHKHVPLMETDCTEAVENNVFGTWNTVQAAEKHGVERFIMVSTDKAVNPTNVMGATKRVCEMIVLNHRGNMKCSATRFGNVLGSAGSVIPLFRRQIAAGGPVTITDKRIIRYFMTIPEASQLVLQSGAMAHSGELFVLDMGKPVRILDLAENMIRLSGQTDIQVVETGLRPGEKLYEELLVKTEELDRTENSLIFIERDSPLSPEEISAKMETLRAAVLSNDNRCCYDAMRSVVPTFRPPEEVNSQAKI